MIDSYGTQTTWETPIKIEERHKIAAMDWLDHDETSAQRSIDSLPIAFARAEASALTDLLAERDAALEALSALKSRCLDIRRERAA